MRTSTSRRLAAILVVGACVLGGLVQAQQIVLVPGTISGVVTIGNLPISQIVISASPQAGGSSSSFSSSPNVANPTYSMTVSVPETGTVNYTVTPTAIRTDNNRDTIRFAGTVVAVAADAPGTASFVLAEPGFIAPTFTVIGSATISSVSLSATFGSGINFEQASTSASAGSNFSFPAIPRNNMSLTGTVFFNNGVQVQLPLQTINVVANQTTSVSYTVDGGATGSIGGTVQFNGPAPVTRLDVNVSGPTSRSIVQQPPPANGVYSVGPLTPGTYSVNTVARFNNNFDDAFTFPNAAYSPGRFNLAVGTGETTVNVSAAQAFVNGTIQLTGASSLQPFLSSGSVNLTGTSASTSGGSSNDQLNVSTRAFDLFASAGNWRFSSVSMVFFRSAPALSGSFSYSDNRPTNAITLDPSETEVVDIPIELGEVTLTLNVAGGTVFSNPGVSGSCVQRDQQNVVLWSSSFSFTATMSNVTQGSVTFATPAGQCTITPRVVINGQTVNLPNTTLGVVAGSSQTVDVGGPTLSNISPAPEAIVSSSSIFVSGRATDDVAVANVTVNGVATNLSSAGNPSDPAQVNFSTISAIPLQRGPNTITTIARDVASPPNASTDTRTVYWDTALPTLSFTPANGFSTFDETVTVSGTASDDAGVQRITVNGVEVSFTSTNNPSIPTQVSFSTTVALVPGSNPITVVVRDISNRTTTQVHTVTRQQQAPTTLTVANASAVYNGTVSLTATLTSQGNGVSGKAIQFTVNGNSASATTNASGVASVSGLSVSGLDVSSYPGAIAASFAGDANLLASNGTATLTVTKATASLTLSNLTHTFNGTPKAATVTTNPAGLSGVSITYNGSTTPPTNGGSYAVGASMENDNYQATNATGTLVINKATATLTLGNLAQTYDGGPKTVSVTTSPAGLTGVSVTYNGSPTVPTNAGSYAVVASLTNTNCEAANALGTLVVNKAAATITLANLAHTYNGSAKAATATTDPSGLNVVSITYNESPTAPTNAGSYDVVASLTNANYDAPNATGTLVISKAAATLTLSALTHTYNGSPRSAGATTNPVGLSGVSITYDGSSTAPTNAGSYAVVAALTNTNYEAPDALGTLVVSKGTATIALAGLTHTFDGSPKSATASTSPAGLTALAITYNGSPTAPTNAGNYVVVATLTNTNYEAPNATGTLTIAKANQAIAITTPAPAAAIYATAFNTAATGGGSGNPVAITAGGACVVSAGGTGSATIQMMSGTGTCTVYYNQAGNANYDNAPQLAGATTAQKAAQTIAVTTGAPAAATFGTSFTVAATGGGSGNAVTFTTPSNDGCSDTGPMFTVTSGVAACQVLYNQAGNANYNAATQVVQTVSTVGYALEGFFAPVDMSTPTATVWNRATAGQSIPTKWRLTLAGAPVASGASFVGLFSYDVSCTTGAGDIEDAIEEYAPGASGLTYDGDGRFHFNWKTPTSYKNRCRAMYVSLSDGSVSPIASFKFK